MITLYLCVNRRVLASAPFTKRISSIIAILIFSMTLSSCSESRPQGFEDFVPPQIFLSGRIFSLIVYGECAVEVFRLDDETIAALNHNGADFLKDASYSKGALDVGSPIAYDDWRAGPVYGAVEGLSLRERQVLRASQCLSGNDSLRDIYNSMILDSKTYYTFSKKNSGLVGDVFLLLIPSEGFIIVAPY